MNINKKAYEKVEMPNGFFTIELVDPSTGEVCKKIQTYNLTTFLGASMIAQNKEPTHIYLEHADPGGSGYVEGSLNGLAELRTDDITTMRTAPRDTFNAESSVAFFSLTRTDPAVYARDNAKTYTANFNDAAIDGRIIVGAGLIVKDGSVEILHSHAYILGFIKPANRNVVLHWTKQFL